MNTRIRSIGFWTVCSWLFCLQSTLAVPLSEQIVSNAVLRATAIQYPATIAAPQSFSTPFGFSKRTVRQVEQLTRRGSVVGYVVSLVPSGYYLVSTDDELPPWKLRADEGCFTNLPPGLIAVLKTEMAEDQETLKELRWANKSPNPKFHLQWKTPFQTDGATNSGSGPKPQIAGVGLLTSTWNQNDPYNYYCPTVTGGTAGGGRAWAGCTACAVAQILRYYTQPTSVAHDYTDVDNQGTCQGSFSISAAGMGAYDWANMPNAISEASPVAQQQAVGRLMYHASIALNSNFEGTETDAFPSNVQNVFQTYFNYTCGVLESKSTYTDSQWYNKIAADIDANKPVFYAMWQTDNSDPAGHAVVCDGYQNGNQIHLNLGWGSALANTWYNMDSVTPPAGFTQYTWTIHDAVFGITPPAPVISAVNPATLPPSASSQALTFSGLNFNFTGPNASTLIFHDPANNPSTVTPVNLTATSMQCGITVGAATGTWTVQVMNGSRGSSPYTFTVSTVNAQLTGLSISGPANVIQNSSGNQYTAKAIMSDGSTPTVTPTWSLNSGAPASISSSGQLTAGSVGANTPITVTASYTYGGITKTANYSVLIMTSSSCGSYVTNLISNGSFANGSSGWTLTGNFQADSRFTACHSCPGYAYLANFDGSPGNSIGGTLSQTVTIPANATSATLGYYYYITTSDSATVAYDWLYLNLVLPGGTLVGIDQKSNKDASSGYVYASFDISAYIGKTITVKFTATNDISYPTVFRVDDVSLIIGAPNPVTPVLFGVGGPTFVAQNTTAQYNAIVVNCDNSVQSVTPSWSVSSGPASISSSGLLTAGSVSADTPATVHAIYNGTPLDYPITVVHVAPVFTSLAISGPSSINDSSSAQFTANAIYSDGSSQSASPTWSITSGPGSISTSGLLTVGQLNANATTTVFGSATLGGITKTTSQNVTVIHVAPPPSLTSLSLSGSNSVNENSTAQYTATAWFSDGSSEAVNPLWNLDSAVASISLYGWLSAGGVSSDTPITLSASYTINEITRNASTNVTIKAVAQPVNLRAVVSGRQVVLTWPTNWAGFAIEWATNVPAVSWVSNSIPATIVNGQYTVTNAIDVGRKFYRLKK